MNVLSRSHASQAYGDDNQSQLLAGKSLHRSTATTAGGLVQKPSATLLSSAASSRAFGNSLMNVQQQQQSLKPGHATKRSVEMISNSIVTKPATITARTATTATVAAAQQALKALQRPAAVQVQQQQPQPPQQLMYQSYDAMTMDSDSMLEDSVSELTLHQQQHQPPPQHQSQHKQQQLQQQLQPQEHHISLVTMPSQLQFSSIAGNSQDCDDVIGVIVRNMHQREQQQSQQQYATTAAAMTAMTRAQPEYMQHVQSDINPRMREILVDWLIEVHLKFKLQQETLFLTVNIVDRFLATTAIHRTKLQLVGCTAMLLASKYEEIYAPEINDFVAISDKAYSKEQILAMEHHMLSVLEFQFTTSSSLRFAERYVRLVNSTFHEHAGNNNGNGYNIQDVTEQLVKYLCELTLQHYSFLHYTPSMIAAAATCIAISTTTHHNKGRWQHSAQLQQESSYRCSINSVSGIPQILQPCVQELMQLADDSNNTTSARYRAVRKKYQHRRYCEVSKMNLSC